MKIRRVSAAIFAIAFPALAAAQVPVQNLRACLEIEDESKERLNCYDEKIAPAPKPSSGPARTVNDCRFVQEEDERLACFNKFVNASPPPKVTAQRGRKEMSAAQRRELERKLLGR